MIETAIKKLSIIIPVFNEKDTILQIIEDIQNVTLPEAVEKELIIVDDGSSDGTKGLLETLDHQDNIRIFYHSENRGKTFAVLSK
jgi:glycosyltransferase involved in cell wall biosynthesis